MNHIESDREYALILENGTVTNTYILTFVLLSTLAPLAPPVLLMGRSQGGMDGYM